MKCGNKFKPKEILGMPDRYFRFSLTQQLTILLNNFDQLDQLFYIIHIIMVNMVVVYIKLNI